MLHIWVQEPHDLIKAVDGYFNRNKTKDWFNRQDVKNIILDIDKTVAVKDEYLESPVFGGMAPERLSTGCKALILMLVQDRPVYATKCGDNCTKYILEIAEQKDLYICMHSLLLVPMDFHCIMEDSGLEVFSRWEYIDEYNRLRSNS